MSQQPFQVPNLNDTSFPMPPVRVIEESDKIREARKTCGYSPDSVRFPCVATLDQDVSHLTLTELVEIMNNNSAGGATAVVEANLSITEALEHYEKVQDSLNEEIDQLYNYVRGVTVQLKTTVLKAMDVKLDESARRSKARRQAAAASGTQIAVEGDPHAMAFSAIEDLAARFRAISGGV